MVKMGMPSNFLETIKMTFDKLFSLKLMSWIQVGSEWENKLYNYIFDSTK